MVEVYGNSIRMPVGDTGPVMFQAQKGEIAEADTGVFTLARQDNTPYLRKLLKPNMTDHAFHMMFVHSDTAKLKPGSYGWSFRVVQGAKYDAYGKILDTESQDTPICEGVLILRGIKGGVR